MKFFFTITGIVFLLQLFAQEPVNIDSAAYYLSKGQYARALPFANRNFEIVKNTQRDNITYIAAATRLTDIYKSLVRFDSALVYCLKVVELTKRLYGETSAQYGTLLTKLATIYRDLAQYELAEQRYGEAAAILKKTEDPYYKKVYASCLYQQADFYITTGNLNKAEELCLDACKRAASLPFNTSIYLSALTQLGRLYEKLGFYAKQEPVMMEIFKISKKQEGIYSYRYAQAVGGLASMYHRNQKLEEADSLYRHALGLYEQLMGKNAPANIALLRRIGIVNTEMGKYDIAEKYLTEAMEIVYKNGGEESPLYPMCGNNLARLYVILGKKELAKSLFQKSLSIYNNLGLILHSGRQDLLYDLAAMLYDDDTAGAIGYLGEAMATESKLLLEKLDFLSEAELLVYLKGIEVYSARPYQFLMQHKSQEIAGSAYNSRLLAKSISLQNTRLLSQSLSQSKDNDLTRLWKNYLQHKSLYTNLLLTPISQRRSNTDSIAASLNQEEKDILRRSADYRKVKENLAVKWQDVQKRLQNDEVSIEFVRFKCRFDRYNIIQPDSVYYAALLIRLQDTVPQFITLCKEKQLIDAMKKFPYKAAVKNRGAKTIANNQTAVNNLYKLVWQPLEPYLTHSKTVYFSPDGLLHQVAFSVIPYKKKVLLCDRYDLVQLTSTRHVVLQESRLTAPISVAMFGGINYNHQVPNEGIAASPAPYSYSQIDYKNRRTGLDSFSFLPYTLTEISRIKTSVRTSKKTSLIFTGGNATEAAFRSLEGSNSPEVIHFATHGFALPDISEQRDIADASFKASDHPLLRCGLVMAGGNKGWKGKAGIDEDDGILTGLEISSVQLPNTQLAVLSACETGLGKIEGTEGVFGLQRAFKLAGVNYVMASLWQVPDKETAEFMETFYDYWLGGKTIREAFLTTQQAMRNKYAPYYWAGFTLVQ